MIQKMAGFSVDRRGNYEAQGLLTLSNVDPINRELIDLEKSFSNGAIQEYLQQLFPDGLPRHGWDYLLMKGGFLKHPKSNEPYIHYSAQIELVFELVRRSMFPNVHSTFQSFFAWQTLDEALAFRKGEQAIYRLESARAFLADQQWLKLGVQSIFGWAHAVRYWRGEPSPSPKWEIVMAAPVRVLEKAAV